jgi:hypothetical protein
MLASAYGLWQGAWPFGDTWAGMRFMVDDGSVVSYERP